MVFLDIQDTHGRGHYADDNQYASHLHLELSHEFNPAQGTVTTYIERFLNKAMLHKQCVSGKSDDDYLTTFATHCAPSLGIKNHEWNAIIQTRNQCGWDLHTTIKYAKHYIPADKNDVRGIRSVKTQHVPKDTPSFIDDLKQERKNIIK